METSEKMRDCMETRLFLLIPIPVLLPAGAAALTSASFASTAPCLECTSGMRETAADIPVVVAFPVCCFAQRRLLKAQVYKTCRGASSKGDRLPEMAPLVAGRISMPSPFEASCLSNK